MDYDKAVLVGAITGMYGHKERWPKEQMLPQTRLPFENITACAYENYGVYLGNLYGDYMKLPPEDKRIPHCDPGYRV